MPTISKIKDKTNDIIYDIEDSEAREDISDLKSEINNTYMYVDGDTLYVISNIADGNEVSY